MSSGDSARAVQPTHPRRAEIGHVVFWIGLSLKAIDAVLEVVGGVVLALVATQAIEELVSHLAQGELREDPTDLVARYALAYLGDVTASSKRFAVLYLLVHGGTKLFVVGAIWAKRLWAYPLAGLLFAAFIGYQLYRYAQTGSSFMLALSALDLVIIALLRPEYRRVKHLLDTRSARSGNGLAHPPGSW